MNKRVLFGIAFAFAASSAAGTEETAPASPSDDAQDVAKKLANPISDMASIPFQFNWENGVGPDEDLRHVLNIQPVVPFALDESWNLIGRWIMPYIAQPASLGTAAGFGDIVASGFFSPVGAPDFTWGAGPVVSLPMTTDPALGSGKWSAGPTAVALKLNGPWVYGMLWNQLWSFASTSDADRPEVSQGFFQPFLAYCTPGGVTYTVQSESSANWLASDEADTWTIPINVAVSKVTRIGPFPMSVMLSGGVYVESPEGGPEWKLRTAFVLLLPKGKE